MPEFLEERLPVGVRLGAGYGDDYNVEITETTGGMEYRHLVHPYPRRTFDIMYTQDTEDLWGQILALYHRAYGRFAGFRVKALDDYTTKNRVETPTAFDQQLQTITAGLVYQLQVAYGAGATPLAIGLPVRTIFKPVTGTVKIAIGTVEQTLGWSVDVTTGRITFTANKVFNITGITQAASAVITVTSNNFTVGETVFISGVLGMTQINNLRATITVRTTNTITVNINSSAFSAYTSGGTANKNPTVGEIVYGGCEYDIPCRFNSRVDVKTLSHTMRESGQIEIIELLNP